MVAGGFVKPSYGRKGFLRAIWSVRFQFLTMDFIDRLVDFLHMRKLRFASSSNDMPTRSNRCSREFI